jgi:Ca-activated chloride channel family protein
MWLGSPIWAPGRLLQDKTSIMRTYVVLGVDPAVADELGWEQGGAITTQDVIAAIGDDRLKLGMPSASQDDAGANFLFAVISSLSERPFTTLADLQTPAMQDALKTIFSAVSGSASDAGKLRDRFVEDQLSDAPQLNGFILPESMAIAANRSLEAQDKTPMRVFYIEDAVGVQDFPLGWVSGLSEEKQAQFEQLVTYLRSDEVQAKIQSQGFFRTGILGMEVDNPDPAVFNPAWGIITDQNFVPATLPKDDVIRAALGLYQTAIKKPSETVYCLDYSSSMYGEGEMQRNAAMRLLLDQSEAATYLLQAGPADSTVVLPFSHQVLNEIDAQGNDPQELMAVFDWLLSDFSGSGTNIYGCAIEALERVRTSGRTDTLPAVILLTDGQHNTGEGFRDLQRYYQRSRLSVPVFSIMLGDASEEDLQPIADLTNGLLCDGRAGVDALVACFKQFRGSN